MLTISEMKEEDVVPISLIEAATFSMPWSAKDFLEMVEADYAHYYVAKIDGVPVGCFGIRDIASEGEITNVVVKSEIRGQGIGRALMEYALREASLRGVTILTLEVRVSNQTAIHLYESFGFKSEGIRPNFYEKPDEDALIMWKR